MKHLIAIAVAAPLMLTGCLTPQTAGVPATIIDFLPADVQSKAVEACGFAGNLQDIAKVISAFGGPSLPGVVGFAIDALCKGRPVLRSRAHSTAAMAEAGVGGRYVSTPRGRVLVRAAH